MKTFSFSRLTILCLVAVLSAGCQRTFIELETPNGTPDNQGNAPTAGPERTAILKEIDGAVETRPTVSDSWAAAKVGVQLVEGSQLRTSADGHALIELTEGSKIRLGPKTTIALNYLNHYLDSLLTSLAMDEGQVWVLLNGGALDVETPGGVASARSAYLSVVYTSATSAVSVSCLQGTCSFESAFIPGGYKLVNAERNTSPEVMSLADFGEWGVQVPEATQLASLATEAVAQGNATLPVMPTTTPSASPVPTLTSVPNQPTEANPSPSPVPSRTPIPPTPLPPLPIIGRHLVGPSETLFCIARGYGVLPAAIAQANGLVTPFTVYPGQTLKIPAVQWDDILPGPVCATQFKSPYPGLPVATPTPTVASTPGAPLTLNVEVRCNFNCEASEGDYKVQVTAQVSGGVTPYTFNPGQSFEVTVSNCNDGTGTVSVTSADGQTASQSWVYHKVTCPNS
jgi:LysM repeat protein